MGGNKVMRTEQKKIFIVVGVFIIFIILTSVLYIIFSDSGAKKDPSKDPSLVTTYVDPGSGETVIETPNQTPENVNGDDIVTLGFTKLLDIGVTSDQLNGVKADFNNYSSTQKTPIKEISITVSSIRQTVNQDSGEVMIEFTATIDRNSSLKAQIEYSGMGDPILKLYNPKNNALLYSSS